MKQEIAVREKQSEVPETVTDRSIFQEANNLMFLAQQHGLAKHLAECAAIYNYRTCGAFPEDDAGGKAFVQTIGMSLRSAQERLRIAKQMQKKVRQVCGVYLADGPFYFNEAMIKQTFAPYFERRKNVGITELLHASRDVQTFTNFLEEVNSGIDEKEIVKLLVTGQVKEASAPIQGDLFGMQNAIKKAGYLLRDDGTFIDPETNEPMTRAQLAEFVDEDTAFYMFRNTKKILTEMKEKVQDQVQHAEYLHAYMLKHPSPETRKLVAESEAELKSLASDILFIATTILHEEEN